jgi:hypothetical protein
MYLLYIYIYNKTEIDLVIFDFVKLDLVMLTCFLMVPLQTATFYVIMRNSNSWHVMNTAFFTEDLKVK